jgi:hypothetical protein
LKNRASYYSGEGEVKVIKMPFFVPDGYTVDFPDVKLNQPLHLTYRLKNLPNVSGHVVEVFFGIKDPRYWTDRRHYDWARHNLPDAEIRDYVPFDELTGNMVMCLKDGRGNVLFKFKARLSEYIWSRSNHGPYLLYNRNFDGRFVIHPGAEYILEVDVDADPMLREDKGFVHLRSGGIR